MLLILFLYFNTSNEIMTEIRTKHVKTIRHCFDTQAHCDCVLPVHWSPVDQKFKNWSVATGSLRSVLHHFINEMFTQGLLHSSVSSRDTNVPGVDSQGFEGLANDMRGVVWTDSRKKEATSQSASVSTSVSATVPEIE